MFCDCSSLRSIEIPDSVKSIGYCAFNNCTNLGSITIPDGVTSISANMFYWCENLESIEIPDSVTSIGEGTFVHCQSLTSITIQNTVTSIGKSAFYHCENIENVYCYAHPETLTWNAKGNDFKGEEGSKETICHVPAKYYETYDKKFGESVNVTFVGDIVDLGLGEHLYGHSLTLDGGIGVNFYVELTDALLASNTAEMVFTIQDGSKAKTQRLLVKDVIADANNMAAIGGKTYYKFKCSVSAKDMASEITAQLADGDREGSKYTYSVREYADYLLAHTEDDAEYKKAAPLVKATLNYGAYSQSYFGIGGTPANDGLDKADKALGNGSIPVSFRFTEANTTLPGSVIFEGATLSLKSEATISLYFKGLPENTVFSCDGKKVETANTDEYVIARIRGIRAGELENNFTVTFKNGSVTYNAMTYCYNVLNGGSEDERLQNVCRALYQYAQAAKTYTNV